MLKLKSVFAILFFVYLSSNVFAQKVDLCRVYGKFYVVTNKNIADFKVYIEESEGLSDLLVYQHTNKFYADKPGQWFFTTNKQEADFWIYFEPQKGYANFSITYTDTESFAGCK